MLRNLGSRVELLHVKDGPLEKGEPNVAVGSGAMPVADVLAAAPSNAWRVIEFDECATDLFTAIGESRAYVAALEGDGN